MYFNGVDVSKQTKTPVHAVGKPKWQGYGGAGICEDSQGNHKYYLTNMPTPLLILLPLHPGFFV